MNLSVSLDFTFTPAGKRVYVWKLIHTMLILFIFLATFNITGDYEIGLMVVFVLAVVFVFVFAGAGAIAVAGASAIAVVGAVAIAGAIAVADVGEKNKKYEISFLSNALSALIQMGLIWLGLYLTQHIKIMFV